MKKLLIISILLLAGCNSSDKVYEKKLKEYGTMYYESYMLNVDGIEKAKISIKDLKNINDKLGDTYDLTDISSCDDKSYVEITLDKNKKIKSYKYDLNCKK